jgi:AcrR family transcriptional regulator
VHFAEERTLVHTYESSEVRKRQIVEAARKLIVERGSEHLTVRALAGEVGLTEAALYRHFASKNHLLAFLLQDIEKVLLDEIDTAVGDTESSLKTLDALVKRRLSSIEQRRGMSFQVFAEIVSLGDKDLNHQAFETIRKYTDRVRDLLKRGVKKGEIKDDIDAAAAATLFFSSLQGLVNIWALGGYSFDLAKRYEPVWQLLRRSIVRPQN